MKISEIDKNFKVENTARQGALIYFDAENQPFKIYGLMKEDGVFCRMPKTVAESVSDGVSGLNCHTAGGRVRFATNSKEIAIKAEMHAVSKMPHFTLCGSSGFDIYIKKNGKSIYYKTFIPPFDISDGYEGKIDFDTEEMREITINFPLYSGVKKLYVGICGNSELREASEYKTEFMKRTGTAIRQ